MYELIESVLFYLALLAYSVAWLVHLHAWQTRSQSRSTWAVRLLVAGAVIHATMLAIRTLVSGHLPILSAFEFVNTFAWLNVAVFALFALNPRNRLLGIFLVPVVLLLMAYAAFLPRAIEPEAPIFNSLLLKFHVLTTLIGYSAWTVTFASSVCFLYLDRKGKGEPRLFDQAAYKGAFVAFCFLTLGIISGALWGDRVFGQLWFWDPKETWSLITWMVFLAYLHARYTLDWRGRRAAIMAVMGFATVIFTYVGVDFLLPQIHGVR